jgi:hypothetical protein
MTAKKHVTKPKADAALDALFGADQPTDDVETAGQFTSDVMAATMKAVSSMTDASKFGRIGQILVAVGHSVAADKHGQDLINIAGSDVNWNDIKERLVKAQLLDRSEADNLDLQASQLAAA